MNEAPSGPDVQPIGKPFVAALPQFDVIAFMRRTAYGMVYISLEDPECCTVERCDAVLMPISDKCAFKREMETELKQALIQIAYNFTSGTFEEKH